MRIAGVVVVYNPGENVFDSINSYINELDKLYVIDNSEDDNGKKFNYNNKIEYVYNHGNLGIATALNIGANKAIKDNYQYLLTMDQDSCFTKNGIRKMIQMIENYSKDSDLINQFGSDINKIGIFSPVHVINNNKDIMGIYEKKYDSPLNVMTSGNIINLNIYSSVKGFNDDYFIDCVDFDYCLKIRKHGYNIVRNNCIILNHELGNYVEKYFLGKKHSSFEHNYIRRYYIVRNRHYLCRTYRNDFPDYCKLELKCSWKELKLVWLCEKDKLRKTIYMLRGYFDYKRGKVGKLNIK